MSRSRMNEQTKKKKKTIWKYESNWKLWVLGCQFWIYHLWTDTLTHTTHTHTTFMASGQRFYKRSIQSLMETHERVLLQVFRIESDLIFKWICVWIVMAHKSMQTIWSQYQQINLKKYKICIRTTFSGWTDDNGGQVRLLTLKCSTYLLFSKAFLSNSNFLINSLMLTLFMFIVCPAQNRRIFSDSRLNDKSGNGHLYIYNMHYTSNAFYVNIIMKKEKAKKQTRINNTKPMDP